MAEGATLRTLTAAEIEMLGLVPLVFLGSDTVTGSGDGPFTHTRTEERDGVRRTWSYTNGNPHAELSMSAGRSNNFSRRPRCARPRARARTRRRVTRASGSRGDPGGGEDDEPEPPGRRRLEPDVALPERRAI